MTLGPVQRDNLSPTPTGNHAKRLNRTQVVAAILLGCLMALCGTYLALTPDRWWFSTDDAVYLGSAEALLQTGRYDFNGLPNLLVYPGTSTVLALALIAFGKQFYLLNLVFVVVALATLWLTVALFRDADNRLIALVTALLLGLNDIFISYIYYLRSEYLFILVVLSALWCWRRFTLDLGPGWLYATGLLTAFAPMVRFEGLFLWGAFALALAWHERNHDGRWLRAVLVLVIAITPFALWTVRNVLLYTPDTQNMVLRYFFGMRGLPMYTGQVHSVDLPMDWQYPVTRLFMLTYRLINGVVDVGMLGTGIAFYTALWLVCVCLTVGIRPWLARASVMEWVFFIALFSFLLSRIIDPTNTRNLVFTHRYFLTLLPFLIFIGVAGAHRLVVDVGPRLMKKPADARSWTDQVWPAVVIVMLIVPAVFGVTRLTEHAGAAWQAYWDERHAAYDRVQNFLAEQVDPQAIVAGTDWGTIPYLTGRRTITIIDSVRHTLRRIVTARAQYLVVFIPTQTGLRPHQLDGEKPLPEIHAYYKTIMTLTRDYPQAFELAFDPGPLSRNNLVAVYKIHLERVEQILEQLSELGTGTGPG